MDQTVWRTSSGGHELAAERHGLRIAVSRVGENGAARFLVQKHCRESGAPALVQSGHRGNVRQAMRAAELAAERLASLRQGGSGVEA